MDAESAAINLKTSSYSAVNGTAPEGCPPGLEYLTQSGSSPGSPGGGTS